MLHLPRSAPAKRPRLPSPPIPIQTDTPPSTLDTFLNLINVSSPSVSFPSLSYAETKDLLLLCERYSVKPYITLAVEQRLWDLTSAGIRCTTWDVLIWAGQRNDIRMGKESLKRMNAQNFISPRQENGTYVGQEKFWKRFGELPDSWQLALVKSGILGEAFPNVKVKGSTVACLLVTTDWKKVADKFKPVALGVREEPA
nr:uncharacterized protein CI109_000814 [Kwoniella shandongensis]KAA5530634.1 hypothetical protein CI109_000814 [Kwoniella shandongensis]